MNVTVFNVPEAITLLNQTIQEEIEQYKQKPPSKVADFYISETLMHNFINAAILVAECLYDYYQTGELVVHDYVGENYDPVEYHFNDDGKTIYGYITEYTFDVPPVSGHNGSDYGKIEAYNILTGQWDQIAYKTTNNGVTLSGQLPTGTYTQMRFYYYTNHDCILFLGL